MKKKGCSFEYGAMRDNELMASFLYLLGTLRGVPLREIYGMAAQMPASRFWVSEDRALTMVRKIRRGGFPPEMTEMKRRMYGEIVSRVDTLLQSGEETSLESAVFRVVEEKAPEFYLTPASAKVIIYRIRRERAARCRLNDKVNRLIHGGVEG